MPLNDEESKRMFDVILNAAKEHPTSNVAKLIFSISNKPNQSDIIILLGEICKSQVYATDFRIFIQYYTDLFQRLNGQDNLLNQTALMIISAAQIYGKRVDSVYEYFENLSLGLTSAREQIEEEKKKAEANAIAAKKKAANEKGDENGTENSTDNSDGNPNPDSNENASTNESESSKNKKGRKKKGVEVPIDIYAFSFNTAEFNEVTAEEREIEVVNLESGELEERTFTNYTSSSFVNNTIVSLVNQGDHDSKKHYRLFTSFVESKSFCLKFDTSLEKKDNEEDEENEEEDNRENSSPLDSSADVNTSNDSNNESIDIFNNSENTNFLNSTAIITDASATAPNNESQDSGLGLSISTNNELSKDASNPSTAKEKSLDAVGHESAVDLKLLLDSTNNSGLQSSIEANKENLSVIDDDKIKIVLPHHNNTEGIPFAELNPADKLLLSPTVTAIDCFPSVPNKENIVIELDDDLKLLLDVPEENDSNVFKIPKELLANKEPELSLNIFKIHEKHFKRKVLFKLGEEFSLFKKARSLKRKLGEEAPLSARNINLLKWFESKAKDKGADSSQKLDFLGFEKDPPTDSVQSDFIGFNDWEMNCSEEEYFKDILRRHEIEQVRAYESTIFESTFPPYLSLKLMGDDKQPNKIRKMLGNMIVEDAMNEGKKLFFEDYMELENQGAQIAQSEETRSTPHVLVDKGTQYGTGLLDLENTFNQSDDDDDLMNEIFDYLEKNPEVVEKTDKSADCNVLDSFLFTPNYSYDDPFDNEISNVSSDSGIESNSESSLIAEIYEALQLPIGNNDVCADIFKDIVNSAIEEASMKRLMENSCDKQSLETKLSEVSSSETQTSTTEPTTNASNESIESPEIVKNANENQVSDIESEKPVEENQNAQPQSTEESNEENKLNPAIPNDPNNAWTYGNEKDDGSDEDSLAQNSNGAMDAKKKKLTKEDQILNEKVQAWHAKLKPILANARHRHHFDIYNIGTEIIETCQNYENEATFEDIMQGKDKTICSRYFLSALMLANTENVHLEVENQDPTRETHWSELNVRLLSTKRHAVAQEDNIGMLIDSDIPESGSPQKTSDDSGYTSPSVKKNKARTNLSVRFNPEVACRRIARISSDEDSDTTNSPLKRKASLMEDSVCELKEEYDTPRKKRLKKIKRSKKHKKHRRSRLSDDMNSSIDEKRRKGEEQEDEDDDETDQDQSEEQTEQLEEMGENGLDLNKLPEKPIVNSVVYLDSSRTDNTAEPVDKEGSLFCTPPISPAPLFTSTPCSEYDEPSTSTEAMLKLALLKENNNMKMILKKMHFSQLYRKVKKIVLPACA